MAELAAPTDVVIARARRPGADYGDVEIKAAGQGLPKSVPETLSAFANGTGGTLLLGLSEERGFAPAADFDAARISDALSGACADKMEPPVRAPIKVEELDGALVLRLDVPELDPVLKPCFIRDRGAYQGSFIRGGDGDRRLTHYEVTQLLSNRGQPREDAQAVPAARLTDLLPELVQGLLARVRTRDRRAFDGLDDDAALVRLGAVCATEHGLRPSLAGLLCLGTYPQQYFPQLFLSFVAVPGTTIGDSQPDGRRFLDNQSINGPIPFVVQDAVDAVERNMRRASVITGVSRVDRYDYPIEVVRELIVNAVMHRDYSSGALGTQVQVELYPNRLVVRSPGGLYGGVEASVLGVEDVSSSRNAVLAKLLADVPLSPAGGVVCENRGSGIPSVIRSLRDAGMGPPEFTASPAQVVVTVPQHALLAPEVLEWIGSLGEPGLSNVQHLALAMMRSLGSVSNEMLRVWGVARLDATQALADLVARGLVTKLGGRRYARYELLDRVTAEALFPTGSSNDSGRSPLTRARTSTDLAAVLEAVRAGHTTSRAIAAQLGLSYQAALRRIKLLREDGRLEETSARHSSAQSYRLTGR